MQIPRLSCYALGSIIFTSLVAAQTASSSTVGLPSPTPSLFPNSSREFYIRADLKDPGDTSKARFNGLYLFSYHTGAGLSDVTLAPKTQDYAAAAWINYINGSDYGQLTFNLNGQYPWTMSADYSNYRQWSPLYINAGQGGNEGYQINENGLVWNEPDPNTSSFGGWIVCDWWHGVPQLFWHNRFYNLTLPCNCAEVWLCPDYI